MTASVPNGERTFIGTAAGTVTFADRYQYVTVTNLSSADPLYVTSDGTTAAVPSTTAVASNTQVIPAGDTRIIANELPLWYQSSNVIPQGVNQFGGGNTKTSPSSPGLVTPMESLAGKMMNPGVSISVASADTTTVPLFVIEAAG